MSLSLTPTEKDLRMTDAHLLGAKTIARARDTFLLLRPSEEDTVLLIKAGYATKSMDVHHKSSNWGPMAGFVPCDPALSKACQGAPQLRPEREDHGDARTVALTISTELKEYLTAQGKIVRVQPDERNGFAGMQRHTKLGQLRPRGSFTSGAVGTANYEYFTATRPPNTVGGTMTFALHPDATYPTEWAVDWLQPLVTSAPKDGYAITPVWVFGYANSSGRVVPVTGDYDLWMVAPHIAWWKLHSHIVPVHDSHGSSAASMFITWLITELNAVCGRSDLNVFNHGAEAQNYGFTQAIDDFLVLVTPGGTARRVTYAQLPLVLADIQRHGYLVVANRRWSEHDPYLMHAASPEDASKRAAFHAAVQTVKQAKLKGQALSPTAKQELYAKAKSGMNPRHLRILEFSRGFDKLLRKFDKYTRSGGSGLMPSDFNNHTPVSGKLAQLQRDLESVLVRVTHGGGESELGALEDWFVNNIGTLEHLSAEIGPAPTGAIHRGSTEETGFLKSGDFVLRSGDGGKTFLRGTQASLPNAPLPKLGGHH